MQVSLDHGLTFFGSASQVILQATDQAHNFFLRLKHLMGRKSTSHLGKLDPVFHPKSVELEGSL